MTDDTAADSDLSATARLTAPVVVDGVVSAEKLAQLLALQTESPALDFKRSLDLEARSAVVELAKDVGAMQVLGGYIVIGVDDAGGVTDSLDGVNAADFDESRVASKLRRYLPEPLSILTNALNHDGHQVVLIFVRPHPRGCAIFHSEGTYEKPHSKRPVTVFRRGEVFWRNGTSSERITAHGFEVILERRIADEKVRWLSEFQAARVAEQVALERAYQSRERATGALGAVNFDLAPGELTGAVLELLRAGDRIALRSLLIDAAKRARSAISREEIETELGDVADKLACLAASAISYDQHDWLDELLATMSEIYGAGFEGTDSHVFGYAGQFTSTERGPRVWLAIIERVFALGALAVWRSDWRVLRTLTLQLPPEAGDYETNWLRHALTMASRAGHLERQVDGRTSKVSLLSRAREHFVRLPCLREDGIDPNSDRIFTSLAQFDLLSNLVAIDDGGTGSEVFYPNFAGFHQTRVQPAADRLLRDASMRSVIFQGSDERLADAFRAIEEVAAPEGWRYDGFHGWGQTDVGQFLAAHPASG